jgi:hypothetical protein
MTNLILLFALVVNDPNKILNQVSTFLNTAAQPFSKTFTCGDQASFDQYVTSVQLTCTDYGCYTVSQGTNPPGVLKHSVSNCTADQISIYSDDGDNLDVSRADYESAGGTVRKLFDKIPQLVGVDGRIDLVSTALAPNFALDPNASNSLKFQALNINARFTPDGQKNGIEILYTILKDAPGVAQVARLRVDQTTIYRLKDIQKAL